MPRLTNAVIKMLSDDDLVREATQAVTEYRTQMQIYESFLEIEHLSKAAEREAAYKKAKRARLTYTRCEVEGYNRYHDAVTNTNDAEYIEKYRNMIENQLGPLYIIR